MKSTHAEVDAIMNAKSIGDTIFVIRLNHSNPSTFKSSKPCLSCQAFMRYKNIKKVIYSNSKGEFETMKL